MKLKELISDLIFPASCVGCGSSRGPENPAGWACARCLGRVQIHSWIFCGLCGSRLLRLARCPRHQDTALRGVGVAADYTDPFLKKLVWAYKYKFVRDLAEPLAMMMARYYRATLAQWLDESPLAVPIPLAGRRMRWRGFNQAEELGQLLSEKLAIPLEAALIRVKHTKPQKEIGFRKKRFENVEGIFAVRDPEIVRQRPIVLVDDVTTSGATLESAARALKSAGAKAVWGLVIARG